MYKWESAKIQRTYSNTEWFALILLLKLHYFIHISTLEIPFDRDHMNKLAKWFFCSLYIFKNNTHFYHIAEADFQKNKCHHLNINVEYVLFHTTVTRWVSKAKFYSLLLWNNDVHFSFHQILLQNIKLLPT